MISMHSYYTSVENIAFGWILSFTNCFLIWIWFCSEIAEREKKSREWELEQEQLKKEKQEKLKRRELELKAQAEKEARDFEVKRKLQQQVRKFTIHSLIS